MGFRYKKIGKLREVLCIFVFGIGSEEVVIWKEFRGKEWNYNFMKWMVGIIVLCVFWLRIEKKWINFFKGRIVVFVDL